MSTPAGVTLFIWRYFFMIHYRKILELHDEGISFRGITANTGNSRQKVIEIIRIAEKKGLVCPLEEEMTIEDRLLPTCIWSEDEDLDHDELVRLAVEIIDEQLEDKHFK